MPHRATTTPAPTVTAPALAWGRRWTGLVARVIAAIVGGYALAALASVAAVALPMPKAEGVMAGMLLSFLVYACAVVWVFAARSALRAWAGLLAAALPLLALAWQVWQGAQA
ncbi:iron uptake protein [Vandammella animalimorsus]|uniref:Iron uptake protein n=1 Tax=Vandammella animalimorsus TaxID=2029117 RepID=A0A2A2AU62_9BURK|nr:DUF3649 domain-containing protein [Vandammella animalimorsus]PAT41234.1 iron uptake protein [Vandammella animalimorsus]